MGELLFRLVIATVAVTVPGQALAVLQKMGRQPRPGLVRAVGAVSWCVTGAALFVGNTALVAAIAVCVALAACGALMTKPRRRGVVQRLDERQPEESRKAA